MHDHCWTAYFNQKTVFNSVDQNSLWLLLQRFAIPVMIISVMKELYINTVS